MFPLFMEDKLSPGGKKLRIFARNVFNIENIIGNINNQDEIKVKREIMWKLILHFSMSVGCSLEYGHTAN